MNTTNSLTVALQDAGLVSAEPALAPMDEVRRGKGTVLVQRFSGTGSASSIKAELKAANPKMSSKALKARVLETLRGERPLREQLAVAWVQGQFQDGMVPDRGERTKNGAALKMIHAPEPVIAAAVIPETKEQLQAKIAEFQAQLDKLNAGNQ